MTLPTEYKIRLFCNTCNGTGYRADGTVYPPGPRLCDDCAGDGWVDGRQIITGITEAFIEIEDKIQELKTKINTMQADINYIKTKVG